MLEVKENAMQRTEPKAETTAHTVELARGRTYKWNVFATNCGVSPAANDPNFPAFTVTLNN